MYVFNMYNVSDWMIGLDFVLDGNKKLKEEFECNTNLDPRTVGAS